jgi:hypothetical protein
MNCQVVNPGTAVGRLTSFSPKRPSAAPLLGHHPGELKFYEKGTLEGKILLLQTQDQKGVREDSLVRLGSARNYSPALTLS